MKRRSFLGTILAAAVAPAIVRADSLMRIVPRETLFIDADLLLPDIGPFIDAMRPENIIGRVVSAQIVSLAVAGIDESAIIYLTNARTEVTIGLRDRLEAKSPHYLAGFFARLAAGFGFGVNGCGGVLSIRRNTSSSAGKDGCSGRLVMVESCRG